MTTYKRQVPSSGLPALSPSAMLSSTSCRQELGSSTRFPLSMLGERWREDSVPNSARVVLIPQAYSYRGWSTRRDLPAASLCASPICRLRVLRYRLKRMPVMSPNAATMMTKTITPIIAADKPLDCTQGVLNRMLGSEQSCSLDQSGCQSCN